jgi:hypothetical protein
VGILGEQLGDRVEVAVPPRSFVAADPAHHVIPVHRIGLPTSALEPVGTLSHAPPRQPLANGVDEQDVDQPVDYRRTAQPG